MATTTRGYTYPASTDHDRIWEHFQTLAEDIDDDVSTIVTGLSKPIGKAVQGTSQTLADNTFTAITLGTEDFDTHNFHSTSSNTSRVTPTVAGYYRFSGTVSFESQTTGVGIDVHFRKNGTTELTPTVRIPGTSTIAAQQVTVLIPCNGSTDYVELMARQDSAGSDNTQVSLPITSVVEWEYSRPL
jgi:hypothetical protein